MRPVITTERKMPTHAAGSTPARLHAPAAAACAALRRFHVSIVRADGRADTWQRLGGNSIDHALEAQQAAGLGGVVRVVPLDLAVA